MTRAPEQRDAPVGGSGAVRLVAHRGLPRVAPENSAASLAAARDAGAGCVELDVRITRDDRLVVLHDRSTARMTGIDHDAHATDARALVDLRLADDPRQSLILLDEALALLAGRVAVDVEVKPAPERDPDTLARAVLDALVRAGSPRDAIVTSSDETVLDAVRARAPMLLTGLVYKSADTRDGPRAAQQAGAALLVANAVRCGAGLLAAAERRGLEVWAYTVNDADTARTLLARGCRGIVTDDWPRLAADLGVPRAGDVRREGEARKTLPGNGFRPGSAGGSPAPAILVLDLGSSSTKALLVDAERGIVARAARPAPVIRDADGRVEQDAARTLDDARALIEEVAGAARGRVPAAAAIASQRSTGLWVSRDGADPLTPAVSWQDRRGEKIVSSLEGRRDALERAADLPLDAAWTAVAGRASRADFEVGVPALLVPLGGYVAARLASRAPFVDPTLANRMFLVDARTFDWSGDLLDAFGMTRDELPVLVPTCGAHGSLDWPGGAEVPLLALVGDQQAAYVGAAGPTGRRLVVNVGTGTFVMRAGSFGEALPDGARRAPLWTSARAHTPGVALVELAVTGASPLAGDDADADERARATARAIALGDDAPREFASRVAAAASRLVTVRDRTALLSGGGLASPHLVRLLECALPVEAVVAREKELTALGAARLAAAAAAVPWRVPPAGGLAAGSAPGV